MKIAVASQNFRTVTSHAGMTRRFLLFEAEPGSVPAEVDRLDLPKEMAFHHFHGDEPHPVDGVEVLIVGGAGQGFVQRLARRGVKVVVTAETDPVRAVADYLTGNLKPAAPHEHGHHHGHEG